MVVSFSYHPRCTRSPSCWKREEYLSWLYSNEAFNPAALNQSDRNEYVSHYSAPGGMHAGFEYYRASPQNASIGARRRIYSNIRRQHHYAYYHIWDEDISSKCTIVPNSGHWIPEEQPKFLVEQLAKFFRE
jgi:pimeloyl-ACP methyl ester carboxylesterase